MGRAHSIATGELREAGYNHVVAPTSRKQADELTCVIPRVDQDGIPTLRCTDTNERLIFHGVHSTAMSGHGTLEQQQVQPGVDEEL